MLKPASSDPGLPDSTLLPIKPPTDDAVGEFSLDPPSSSNGEDDLTPEEKEALERKAKRKAAIEKGRLHPGHVAWRTPLPFDFVLPGLQAGEVGMLPAPGGTGKTFLMLQLAMSIATGTAFAGAWDAPKKGRVVFVTAEDTLHILQHRLFYMRPDISWQPDLIQNMEVISLAGQIPRLLEVGRNRNPVRGEWFDDILELAKDARLLIVDPLSRFHSCDENDASHMTTLVQTFEAIASMTGCAILFTHHSNKNAQQHGAGGSQASARGSSALTDGVRWQMNMWKMSSEDAKANNVMEEHRWKYVALTMAKANNIPMDTVTWLERGEGGVLKAAAFMKPGGDLDLGVSTAFIQKPSTPSTKDPNSVGVLKKRN
jgi:hypothetical protein